MNRNDQLSLFFAGIAAACSLLSGCGGAPEPEAPPEPAMLISQKASKSLGWYSFDGRLVHEVAVSDHPHEIVRSPDGRRLYMTDNGVMRIENAGDGGNKVSIIDIPSRERIGEVDLGQWRRPHGIDLCADGTLLVTTEFPDQLLIIDVEQQAVANQYDTGGETPHIVHCSPDSTTAYVSNSRSRTVAKIEMDRGDVKLLETGDRPEGSTLSRDGSKLYVAHRDADKIVVVDTAEWKILGEIPTGKAPVRCGLNADETIIAYGLYGDEAVGFADLTTMQEIAQIKLAGPAVSLEVEDDGATALACAQDQDVCYVISMAERKILHTVKTREGAGPDPALLLD